MPIGKSSKDFLLALFEEKVYSYAGFEKLISNILVKLSRTGNLESLDPSKFNQAMDDFLVEFQGSSFLNSIPESKLTECKSRIKTLYQTFEKRFKAIEDPDGKIDKAKLGSISLIAKVFSAKAEESLLQPMKNNEIKKPVNVWVLLKDFFISAVSSIRKNEVKPLPDLQISENRLGQK